MSAQLAQVVVRIEYRSAEGQSDRLPELAADLVRRHVTVIAAVSGTNSALAAKAATATIPIVFLTGGDPVKLGLVASLNRPEANITGITFLVEELGAKDIGLLHELLPDAKSVGVLVNPSNPAASQQIMNLQQAARTLGLDLQLARAGNSSDLDEAFFTVADRKLGALLVGADPLFGSNVDQIVALAARHRIPTVYYRREFADAGGLISYGTSAYDAWRQVGNLVVDATNARIHAVCPGSRGFGIWVSLSLRLGAGGASPGFPRGPIFCRAMSSSLRRSPSRPDRSLPRVIGSNAPGMGVLSPSRASAAARVPPARAGLSRSLRRFAPPLAR